jgi:integrase
VFVSGHLAINRVKPVDFVGRLLVSMMPFTDGDSEIQQCSKYLFPSSRDPDQPAPKNRIGRALVDVGYSGDRHVPHGFRSTFSTLANESGKWSPDAIELQLAHVESNRVRRAYNRNVRWEERVALMAWYADYLDELKQVLSKT